MQHKDTANTAQSFLRIWSHLLKNPLMKNFIFCAVEWPSIFFDKKWSLMNNFTEIYRRRHPK